MGKLRKIQAVSMVFFIIVLCLFEQNSFQYAAQLKNCEIYDVFLPGVSTWLLGSAV